MTYWLGIDGGGSHLRAVVTGSNLGVIAQAETAAANPGIIGHEESARRIHAVIEQALRQADLSSDQIAGVGIGIAGASAAHSETWLRGVLNVVLPDAWIVPSNDCEIALVGAHAERCGILLLSGTGSIAYGINRDGTAIHIGGWGYLMGDEGSGFRIGLDALAAITRAADGRGEATELTEVILQRLELSRPQELITWLYKSRVPRNAEVAELAITVMEAAGYQDGVAIRIIETAAQDLSTMCQTLRSRPGYEQLPVGFAGGLLSAPNRLSCRAAELLGLSEFPVPKYPPVVGAALLAQLSLKDQSC